MRTIVLGTGLTEPFLSPEGRFRQLRAHVGRHEAERLMGRGSEFGRGPLAEFLRRAIEARGLEVPVGVVLLEDEEGWAGDDLSSPPRLVEPLRELEPESRLIRSSAKLVPQDALLEAIRQEVGLPTASVEELRDLVRFLVVGCHTDGNVLAISILLRSVLGFEEVAVSSHLVGSATQDAHFAALRHNFLGAGVAVFLDLEESARYAGLDPGHFSRFACQPCQIGPEDAAEALNAEQRRIVELICMHWTRAELKPLQGGFSGSLLLLAEGWKGAAHTEPLVLKIDEFAQMRRELDGYYQVKDLLGKNVPSFGYPVGLGDSLGVGMELAAMEGRPETLQDSFEDAESEIGLTDFLGRLDKALSLLSQKLYQNTEFRSWVAPYRAFGLHTDQQIRWMRDNTAQILDYCKENSIDTTDLDPSRLERMLRLVASNEDGLESEVSLAHGDLNFANVICDEGDNIWFIDWTHCGQTPLELDFAKLENDLKFVMSKQLGVEDLDRLKRLEDYLLTHKMPAGVESLPRDLQFAKWDLRYRKILEGVRRVRKLCFSLKDSDDWLVYRVALLRYALHTLSFDSRRDQGECELPQLLHALYSVQGLAFDLVMDDFHLKIRAERPGSYPPRLRLAIDEAPWIFELPGYEPPYHVDPDVLANDRSSKEGGWADPEDFSLVRESLEGGKFAYRDEDGRPVNPRGRTGMAGRGLLGRWGPNLAVGAIVTRGSSEEEALEILLGRKKEGLGLALPKGFVLPNEPAESAVLRVVEAETGWKPSDVETESVMAGYMYDSRQTDHAWVEIEAFLFHLDKSETPTSFRPVGDIEELAWCPLDAASVNQLPSQQAVLARAAVKQLAASGRMDESRASDLLAETGKDA